MNEPKGICARSVSKLNFPSCAKLIHCWAICRLFFLKLVQNYINFVTSSGSMMYPWWSINEPNVTREHNMLTTSVPIFEQKYLPVFLNVFIFSSTWKFPGFLWQKYYSHVFLWSSHRSMNEQKGTCEHDMLTMDMTIFEQNFSQKFYQFFERFYFLSSRKFSIFFVDMKVLSTLKFSRFLSEKIFITCFCMITAVIDEWTKWDIRTQCIEA